MATNKITVLALGSPLIRQPNLFSAALERIGELLKDSGVIVLCPTPMILAGALTNAGYRTVALSGGRIDSPFLREIVNLGGIPVVDGGQRDAIEIASQIGAAKAIVYTEAEGVMSAHPGRVNEAVSVRYISHLELMELADQRASPISVEAAHEATRCGVNCEIRSVAQIAGTVVRSDNYEDRFSPITSITVASGYGLVLMRAKPAEKVPPWASLHMQLLERIAAAGISLEMLQSFAFMMRFLAPANRLQVLRSLAHEYDLQFHAWEKCAKICIVGTGVRCTAGVFYRSLRALSNRGVPVLHFADSNVTLAFVVNESFARLSEQALHQELAPGSDIAVGPAISFDADLGLVRISGREVRLGSRQAQMLRFLLDNVGRVVEAEELSRHLFGGDSKDQLVAVRVHLHNLRKKIESNPENPRYIVTVPEQGYVFVR